jgi:hypothetical protein
LIKIVFSGRNKRRPDLLVIKVLPWKVHKPRMILDINSTIVTQSILWFSLYHLIDEISCFN